MNKLLSQSWWVLTFRGIVGILFGVAALMLPVLSLAVLLVLFVAYTLLGGIASVVGALRHRKENDEWWLPFLFGLVAIGAGIIAFFHPELTLLVLILLIGANALIGGALDLAMAIHLRKTLHNEWLLVLNAIVSMLFGVLVFLMPDAGALAVAWMIGIYALLSGCLLLTLAFRLRQQTGGKRPYIMERMERRVLSDRRTASTH